MLRILSTRMQQGRRTLAYPATVPILPDRLRGRPALDPSRCEAGCHTCVEVCPAGAITAGGSVLRLDAGRCLFCGDCAQACPSGALAFTHDHRLATRTRADLVLEREGPRLAPALDEQARRLFGRSLRLRQVSGAGCNACEADINVLSTVVFDLGRFGIQFVASPRHADGIVVTGPVSENMRVGLEKTWQAIPGPKIAIAVGACAISGGPFAGSPEVHDGCGGFVPLDLFVPGCPPHPLTILDGLLRLLGRIDA